MKYDGLYDVDDDVLLNDDTIDDGDITSFNTFLSCNFSINTILISCWCVCFVFILLFFRFDVKKVLKSPQTER